MSGLAVRLREARERVGLSARALDEKAAITPGHTTLIESGRRESPAVETIRKLAAALGVSIDWLVTGEERGSGPIADPDDTGDAIRAVTSDIESGPHSKTSAA